MDGIRRNITNSTQSRVTKLCGQLQMLKIGGLTIVEYMLKAKILYDHLASTG